MSKVICPHQRTSIIYVFVTDVHKLFLASSKYAEWNELVFLCSCVIKWTQNSLLRTIDLNLNPRYTTS